MRSSSAVTSPARRSSRWSRTVPVGGERSSSARRSTVEGAEAIAELEKKIANTGYYAHRCTAEEEQELAASAEAREELFARLIVDRVKRWVELAEERLVPLGIPCLVNAGNDDPREIDEVIDASSHVQFLEGRVVELPDGTEVASCGYANRTPWDCPRDVEETELVGTARKRRVAGRRSRARHLQLPLPALRHRDRRRPQALGRPPAALGGRRSRHAPGRAVPHAAR